MKKAIIVLLTGLVTAQIYDHEGTDLEISEDRLHKQNLTKLE